MKTILVIGIGVGDPDQLTLQAVQALRRADVLLRARQGPREGRPARPARGDPAPPCRRAALPHRRSAEPAARRRAGRLSSLRRRAERGQAGGVPDADRGAGGGRDRRLPRLGRSDALRQHAAQPRCPQGGRPRLHARGHSRHHRHPGTGGRAQDPAQPNRRGGDGHYRPAARRRLPARHRQRRRAARRRGHLSPASSARTSRSSGAPISARPGRSWSPAASTTSPRKSIAGGMPLARPTAGIMDTYLLRRLPS